MKTHTLTIPDDENYRQIVRLTEAIGLQVGADGLVSPQANRAEAHVIRPALTDTERQHHLAVIAGDGNGQSIADPVVWQREMRKDRSLPGRD
jgi:hypothetical protein